MRVSGSVPTDAGRAEVWRALSDPRQVAEALPGDGALERLDDGGFAVTVTAGVAGTRGTYRGTVQIVEVEEPDRCRVHVELAGEPGTVRAEVALELSDDAVVGAGAGEVRGTTVEYRIDAEVLGRLAAVGRQVVAGSLGRVADELLSELGRPVAAVADGGLDSDAGVSGDVGGGGDGEVLGDVGEDVGALVPSGRRRTWAASALLGAVAALVGVVMRRRSRGDGGR